MLLIATFAYQIYKKDDVMTLLDIMNEFDTKAGKLGMKMDMRNARAWLVKITSFVTVGVLPVSVATALVFELEINYGNGYTMPLFYGYALLYLSLYVLQFSFATLAIKHRFFVLNKYLRLTFRNSPIERNTNFEHNANGHNEHLPIIITDMFGNLNDGIDLVNDSFTL